MKSFSLRSTLCAAVLALAATAPAHASIATFEDVTPGIFFDGDSFTSGGLSFTMANATGGLGFGVVDTAAAFAFGNAPTGTHGQFLGVLNDGAVLVQLVSGNPFNVLGLDFGFIGPLPNLAGGGPVGQLLAVGVDTNNNLIRRGWNFTDDGTNFTMSRLGTADLGALATTGLTTIGFYACLYDNAGVCTAFAGDNLGQFALDDISTRVPEPSSLALFSLAFAAMLMFATRRRSFR